MGVCITAIIKRLSVEIDTIKAKFNVTSALTI